MCKVEGATGLNKMRHTQHSGCASVGRYDVEVFQKIEEVRKVKLEEYVVQRGEIIPLMDSINSAQSMAVKQVSHPPSLVQVIHCAPGW